MMKQTLHPRMMTRLTGDKAVSFSFLLGKDGDSVEGIELKSKNSAVSNNLQKLHIKAAYQIHTVEVEELLRKREAYSKTQCKEFQEVLSGMKLTEEDVKEMVFGKEIAEQDRKTKPLGKMMSDLHKELGIY